MATRTLRYRQYTPIYQYMHAQKDITFSGDPSVPDNWNDIWTQEEADDLGSPSGWLNMDGGRWWAGNKWQIRRTAVIAEAASSLLLSGYDVVGWGFRVAVGFATGYTSGKIIIQQGDSTHPHDTPEAGDFDKDHYSGNLAEVSYSDNGKMIDIDLPVGLLNANGDPVRLVIRTEDDINGIEPSAYLENLSGRLVMWNYPYEDIENSPHIYVEVTVRDLDVETENPENLESDGFDMLGNIENCSIEFIDSKGFEWKEGELGVPVSVEAPAGFMANCRYKYSLEVDTTKDLYYRAWGENENGKFYGNWVRVYTYTLTNVKAEKISSSATTRLYGEIS